MKIAAFPLYLHQPKLATGRECKCQKIKLKGSTIRKLRHTIYAVFCYSNPTHLTGPRLRESCEVTGHRSQVTQINEECQSWVCQSKSKTSIHINFVMNCLRQQANCQ
jgi:hypothetical protein